MKMPESVVAEIPLFAGLPGEDTALIADCSSNVRFHPGKSLGREGSPANPFFFLRSDRVVAEPYVRGRSSSSSAIAEKDVRASP